jgi:hypothetical protein
MNGTVPPLSEQVWLWLCEPGRVRASAVAAGRARVAADDWPTPLALADAILAQVPPSPSRRKLARA